MPVFKRVKQETRKVSLKALTSVSTLTKVDDLDLRYDKGVRTMNFYGKIRAKSRPGHYNLMITFKDVDSDTGLTEEEVLQGFQPKPILNENEIMVRCSCPNYRFRFDKANRSWRVGTGPRFGTYIRKTNRKSSNPGNNYGFCSHIIEFVNYLQKNGFVH